MANLNKISKQHEELIQALEFDEFMSYLEGISKKKIDSLGFFKAEGLGSSVIGSVEEYNKYSEIQGDITSIYANKIKDNANKEILNTITSGLAVATDFDELRSKYIEQIQEAKILYFNVQIAKVNELCSSIGNGLNYLVLMLGNYYLLLHNRQGTKVGKSIEEAFNGMIEEIYTDIEKNISEFNVYSKVPEMLDLTKIPEELSSTIKELIYFIELGLEYIKKLEEVKANPFYDSSKFVAMEYMSLVFEEPVTDLDSFKESLETEEDLAVFNCIVEGFTTDIATYDFKNFKIILPERPEEEDVEGAVN